MKKILFAVVATALVPVIALAGSTINPTVPAANSPISSAPIRNNFQAAYNDINSINNNYSGALAPSNPGTSQFWRDTSTSPTTLRIYDGSQWLAWGKLDSVGHSWSAVGTWQGSAVAPAYGGTGQDFSAANGVLYFTAGVASVGTAPPSSIPPPTPSTLGGVFSKAAVSNQFLTQVGTDGTISAAQPGFSNLSGVASSGQLSGSYTGITGVGTVTAGTWSASTVGVPYGGTGATSLTANGVLYGNGVSAVSALALNATATNKYLQQVSSGAPSWQQIALSDLSDASSIVTLTGSQILSNKTLVDPTITTSAAGANGTINFFDSNVTVGRASTTLSLYGRDGVSITSNTGGNITLTAGTGRVVDIASDMTTHGITWPGSGGVNNSGDVTIGNSRALKLTGSSSGTITVQPQAAAGTFNFNLPITAGTSGYVLTSAGGGSSPMTWTQLASVATSGSASDLSTGTVPDARFPATLPAISGVNLTNLNATNLASGTVASARVSGSYTGITGTGTLTAGATGAGFTVAVGTSTVTGVLPAANGGAGTITGALKANGSGTVSQAACADLSNAGSGCSQTVTGKTAFTPVLQFNGGSTGMTGTFEGKYVVSGDHVTVWIHIALTNKGSSTGTAFIANLPFNIANDTAQNGTQCSPIGYGGNMTGGTAPYYPYLSGTNGFLRINDAVGGNVTDANFTNTSEIVFTCSYMK